MESIQYSCKQTQGPNFLTLGNICVDKTEWDLKDFRGIGYQLPNFDDGKLLSVHLRNWDGVYFGRRRNKEITNQLTIVSLAHDFLTLRRRLRDSNTHAVFRNVRYIGGATSSLMERAGRLIGAYTEPNRVVPGRHFVLFPIDQFLSEETERRLRLAFSLAKHELATRHDISFSVETAPESI